MAKFPVTLKRRNSIGKVVKVSCSTVKDAIRILQRFRQSGYRDVWFEDLNGNMVDGVGIAVTPATAAGEAYRASSRNVILTSGGHLMRVSTALCNGRVIGHSRYPRDR
jgi:hypothetical protein